MLPTKLEPSPGKLSLIPATIEQLYNELVRASDAVNELKSRLEPVMVVIPENDKVGGPIKELTSCLMADKLQGAISQLVTIRQAIDAIIGKLEI